MPHLTDVFDNIVSLKSLKSGLKSSSHGKIYNSNVAHANYLGFSLLLPLQRSLIRGDYHPLPYTRSIVFEPKLRVIYAPNFSDRIIHHAIHDTVSPFFERFFIADSYACRTGRGTHAAAAKVRQIISKRPQLYCLQLDISKFFPSINHDRLKKILIDKIDDERLLQLLFTIIDSYTDGGDYDHLFPPDSPYHTHGAHGIPIGNLTSQLFANIYLHTFDMYAKQHLHTRLYIRYMDDVLIFHTDKAQLRAWQKLIEQFLQDDLYLTLNPRKVRLYPARNGINFVGYKIFPNHIDLLGKGVRRFRKHFTRLLVQYRAGKIDLDYINHVLGSWSGHAKFANANGLIASFETLRDSFIFDRMMIEIQQASATKQYHRSLVTPRHRPAAPPIQLDLFPNPSPEP